MTSMFFPFWKIKGDSELDRFLFFLSVIASVLSSVSFVLPSVFIVDIWQCFKNGTQFGVNIK